MIEPRRRVYWHANSAGQGVFDLRDSTADTDYPVKRMPFLNQGLLVTQEADFSWTWERETTEQRIIDFRNEIVSANALMLDWEDTSNTINNPWEQRNRLHSEIMHWVRSIYPDIDVGWFNVPPRRFDVNSNRFELNAIWDPPLHFFRKPTALFLQMQTNTGLIQKQYLEDILTITTPHDEDKANPPFTGANSGQIYAYIDATIGPTEQTEAQVVARLRDISVSASRCHIVVRDRDDALVRVIGYVREWLSDNHNNQGSITSPFF